MFKQILLAFVLLIGAVSCFPESRVVNGTDTKDAYPFMAVSLRYYGFHSCGGTIVASRWILTAAHCIDGTTPLEISILFGEVELKPLSHRIALVERIYKHEEYSPAAAYANDIALLYLRQPLDFDGKRVGPVKLPPQDYDIPQVPEGAPGKLIGWGLDKSGGSIQEHLQEVDLKIYSDEECKQRHNGVPTSKHICGGVDEGGKGQCSGDSGGPLMERDTLVQLGIVSWSVKPCAVYPYPGVYTKVSRFIDWIEQKMAALTNI